MGLSSQNRNFIVGIIAAVLLIFGPIEPYGLVARIAYLIIIPTAVWLSLRYWGSRSNIDAAGNERLRSALFGGVAGALLVGASLFYTARYHTECDQTVQTSDGTECVGNYVPVKGGDKAGALLFIVIAAIASWCAVSKRAD